MQNSFDNAKGYFTVKVAHDFKRQLLEILSLFRVMNSYYNKKEEIQTQIRPIILKKFKEGIKTLEADRDWLFTIPTALNTLSEDFLSKKDSFRFPDSIILFEAYMNLGLDALYPRVALQFKFPGLLKNEKYRNVFQFIYSTSRGFGFPIYFGPEFYEYKLKYEKIFEPFLKWGYVLCHKFNQGIFLIGDKRLKSKRHHPGEFESVIVSEYENNVFKGIDTLLHGYFTNEPKFLGKFTSLHEGLQDVMFSYTIGDHAMSVEKHFQGKVLEVPLITYENIVRDFDVDFYSYIEILMKVNRQLIKKIAYYKKIRKELINNLKFKDRTQFFFEQWKKRSIPGQKFSQKFSEIEKYSHYNHLMEKLREFLFTTPLYMHTIHTLTGRQESSKFIDQFETSDEFNKESRDSILLSYIQQYEKNHDFMFEEPEVIRELKELKDQMAKMWLYFKERHFRYAVRKLNDATSLSLDDRDYKKKVNQLLDALIPIISVYEIFQRPLSESVYPESIPQTKRLGAYLAKFLTSKYNPMGINIMNLFNNLAFHNWCFFIKKKKLNRKQFFDLTLRLPIWKHIPAKIKMKILSYDS